MVSLGKLLQILNVQIDNVDLDKEISSINIDSREVSANSAFVALSGQRVDGHSFIPQAVMNGAALVIVSRDINDIGVPVIKVENPRQILGIFASEINGNPSTKLDLIGVTGTNGKTTTSFFVRSVLRAAGIKTELIGTTGYTQGDKLIPLDLTTPESPLIQKLLSTYVQDGTKACVMEVSSHAVAFKRITGCRYRSGVFTNITDREHLDFHKTFDNYLKAKKTFFSDYITPIDSSYSCLNADDPHVDTFMEVCGDRVILYSKTGMKDAIIQARKIQTGLFGVTFQLQIDHFINPVTIRLPGPYNVDNALAATSVAYGIGISPEQIVAGLETLDNVPGRFEQVRAGQDFAVIVDYAHTDDALKNLLEAARACGPKRLITVFGCGGDRDTSKRSLMGSVAAQLSDYVIVTSDNPRSEDPLTIINQIMTGIPKETEVNTIPDRATAIRTAIKQASTGDMVVIAGKGHEDYQIFRNRTIHFDDREQARMAIQED